LVFFTLLGRREFHLDVNALGLLLVSDALAPLIGNFFWGKWADRFGNRWVLGSAALVSIAAPAIALGLGLAGEHWPALVLAAFSVIVAVVRIASVGVDLASKNFVLDLSPDEHRRPVYIGVNDTLIALPTMVLAGGGLIIDRLGFPPVFIACVICSAIAALLCSGLVSRKCERTVLKDCSNKTQ
jgi:MFS family permease